MNKDILTGRNAPGERLTKIIWLMSLSWKGSAVTPTVERVNQIKLLAARWAAEDEVALDHRKSLDQLS